MRNLLSLSVLFLFTSSPRADDPKGPLADKLAKVTFKHYAEAPGYSEGPTWRNGEVFFCSGALLRVDEKRGVHKYLELNPAGTVLRGDGHLLVVDNKYKAVLDISPEGKVGVIADRWEGQPLRSLNDLTVDARGNIYWTDPEGSTPKTPVGSIFRLRPDGRVDRVATGLAFPNGLDVDPASKFLYVIESQSKRSCGMRFRPMTNSSAKPRSSTIWAVPAATVVRSTPRATCGSRTSTARTRRQGRITVLSPEGKPLAYLTGPREGREQHRVRRQGPRRNLLHDGRPAGGVSREGRREGLRRSPRQADEDHALPERRADQAARGRQIDLAKMIKMLE